MEYYKLKGKRLIKNKDIKVYLLEDRVDIYNDMARTMVNKLKENNNKGKKTSFILPVGPSGQYVRFAQICNYEKISCSNLITINMDEYLDEQDNYISEKHPTSFRAFMQNNLFKNLNYNLRTKPENIFFPDPKDVASIEKLIMELGGVDICFGGVGINGHIAFNEPIRDGSVQVNEYKKLKTRVLSLSKETIVMNSLKYGGYLELIPRKCITIGMYEILMSKEIRFYLEHDWQSAVLRKIIFEKPTPCFPATIIKDHKNSSITLSKNILMNYMFD